MKKRERIYKVIIIFVVSFGLFANISSDISTNLVKTSASEYIQSSDETIDGNH